MKTKHYLFGALAAMMLMTSCQDDTTLLGNEGEVMVSFNLETPQIATRAFSDGSVANLLQYAVYDQNDELLPTHSGTVSDFTGSATINLKLSSGNSYSAIFWAANENAPYDVNFTDKTMTVNYTNAVSNDETRDAFYKYQEFTVEGNQTVSVELKRPFAQLNIGTNDFDEATAASYAPTQSAVTVKKIANTLNLCDGTVSGEQDVTFGYNTIPAATEPFPVADYRYLAMNYVLVGKDKEVFDIVYMYRDNNNLEQTNAVGSVPMQRNYRTNIYGSLLTNDVKVEVDMEPDYDGNLPGTLEEELIIASQVGGTVTLTEDVVLTNPLIISGDQTRAASAIALELDLNGNTLSYTSDLAAHSAMITIQSGNKLVIKDSKGNGKVSYNYTGEGDSNFGWGTYTIANYGGDLVIEDAAIEIVSNLNETEAKHMYCSVFQYSGATTINGGTISNSTYRSVRLWKGEMTINDGIFEGQVWVQAQDETAVLTINGGSFAPRGLDGSSVFVTNGDHKVTLKVTDGTFATKIGCTDFTKEGVKGSVSGGVFGAAVNENLLADGYKAIQSGENWIVVEDEIDNVTTVGTAEDLMNALNSLFAGNKVVLEQDIDLTGKAWDVSMPWQGSNTDVIFDGNGHKITGLSTTGLQGGLLGKYNSNGNITIKNLTLVDVTINGTDVDGESAGGALIGWIENHGAGTITIENVHVEGIKAEGFKYIGGLIGYNNGNVDMHVSGCSVIGKTDSYLNSTYNESGNYKGHVGGLLGLWMRGSLTNCEVKDLTIKHGTNDMTGSSNRAGALVGTKYAGVEVVSATVENVTIDGNAATAASLFGPNASSASESDKSNVTIK